MLMTCGVGGWLWCGCSETARREAELAEQARQQAELEEQLRLQHQQQAALAAEREREQQAREREREREREEARERELQAAQAAAVQAAEAARAAAAIEEAKTQSPVHDEHKHGGPDAALSSNGSSDDRNSSKPQSNGASNKNANGSDSKSDTPSQRVVSGFAVRIGRDIITPPHHTTDRYVRALCFCWLQQTVWCNPATDTAANSETANYFRCSAFGRRITR